MLLLDVIPSLPYVSSSRREGVKSGDGWEVRDAASAKQALALVTDADVECVLLDYRLPDADGLTCLRELRRVRSDVPVVMVTGAGSEAIAVEAMKLGAADSLASRSSSSSCSRGASPTR